MARAKKTATKRKVTKRKRAPRKRRSGGTLASLRRQAQAVIQQFRRAGRRQIKNIEQQMAGLEKQRQALVSEIGAAVGIVGGRSAARPRPVTARRRAAPTRRRATRTRVDWTKVYAKLPRGSFQARDVRRIVPGVAGGTLSQRLTAWVKAKKLRRTGSRRGTRYRRP